MNGLPPSYESLQAHGPDLSIVIPMLHPRPRTFGAIRGNLRAQCLKPFSAEWVLISNGGEGTVTICRDTFQEPETPLNKYVIFGVHSDVRESACNVGVAAAWNAGLAQTEGEIVIFLNDDAVPDAETVLRMAQTLKDQPEVGVVGVEGHNFEWAGPPPMDAPNAGCFRGFDSYGIDERRPHWKVPPKEGIETQVVTGHCFAARRADLIALNGFDLRYSPAFAEEYDFCFKMREILGKRVLTIPGNVKHAIGVSRPGGGLVYLTGYVNRDPLIVNCNWLFHRRWHPESPERMR
jgi:glycosyltransferase involved in cell wall biosynthesis